MTDKVESSLVVDYWKIRSRAGRVLGLPSDDTTWDQSQEARFKHVLEDGLRRYYSPPAVDEYGPHVWSFMYPTIPMKTCANQQWYPAPDGFTGDINDAGGITYSGTSKSYRPIRITSASHMRSLSSAESESTGYPRYAAVRPKSDRGETEQEWEIGFHPIPDAEYEFEYQCHMAPYMLTEERPYPLGGQAHSQGILFSVLAAAEAYEFDRQGDHYNRFIEQLKADIAMDQRRAPATLGYGGVHRRGGFRDSLSRHRSTNNNVVTYNSQEWD